jgi:hypothetical protein
MTVASIPGATGSTYTLVTADLDQQISVKVTATNSAGSANASSALTAPVIPVGWSRVPLGPGGLISGLSFHSDGTKICRMDTSGAYVWLPGDTRWKMCVTKTSSTGDTGSVPDADSPPGYGANPGTFEVAVAPSDSTRMYMMWGPQADGRVWKSDNKGTTWVKTARATDTFNANSQAWRHAGRKMAVDPINKDVVICGGSLGVTMTANGGTSWTTIATSQIPASTATGPDGAEQVYLFCFDPNSAQVGGKTQGIYCFSVGVGVYKTTNGGTTWTLAAASGPTTAIAMAISTAGKVFVTPPASGDLGMRMLPSGGAWSTVTTDSAGVTAEAHAVNGVACDPTNALRVVALSEIGALSYSTDGGATWTGYGTHVSTFGPITWMSSIYGGTGTFGLLGLSLTFDPSDGTIHQGHGLGTCKTTPTWTKTLVTWVDNSLGLEQLCAKRLLKPPGNPKVILAAMDMGMFACDGTNYPSTKGTTDSFCAAWSADYCPSDPNTIVCILNQSPAPLPFEVSGKSSNGGTSWSQFASKTFNADNRSGGMIACGSNPNNYILALGDNGAANGLYYTTNGGTSWTLGNFSSIPAIPASGDVGWLTNYYYARQTLCSDKVLTDTFYGRNNNAGYVRSTDGGATWALRFAVVGGTYANARLQAVPGNAGHLFYASGLGPPGNFYDAMVRSVDGCQNWTQAHALVKEVHAIGFGKALAGGYPTIYIAGYYNNVYGIYRSSDNCVTWVKIGDYPMGCFDSAVDITGDMDVYGTCYVSLGASGIFKYVPGS